MITAKYNGGKIQIPSSYSELTVDQFIRMRDHGKSPVDVLSILTGKEREFWAEQVDRAQVDAVLDLVQWIHSVPDTSKYLRPDKIEIEGNRYSLPEGLGLHTVDQQYCFEELLQERKTETDIDLVVPGLAIYFQPLIDERKFDRDRLPAIEAMIKKVIIAEAFPTFAFFLKKYFEYLKEKANHLHTNQAKTSKGLELIDSKSLVSSERLNPFRRVCAYLLSEFLKWTILPTFFGYGTTKKKAPSKKD